MNEDFGEASFLFIKPYGTVGCSFFSNKYFILILHTPDQAYSVGGMEGSQMRRDLGVLLCPLRRNWVLLSQHFFPNIPKPCCWEMGFRLKVTLLCDFCAFRKTLSVLQMACSCYIWQESTRVSRRRLSLVSYCELTSHFSVGFLLSVRAFVQLHFLRNNCLS